MSTTQNTSSNSSNWAQAALSSSSGLLGGIWDTIWQNKNIEKTLDMNRELSDYAYSKDLEQWNRQNLYNNPASQMQRFKDAGLNPNMIYGTGSASAGNASQLPKYSAPTADYTKNRVPNLMGAMAGFTDTAMKVAQRDNVKAQTQLTHQQTLTEGWNSLMKEITTGKEKYKWLGGYNPATMQIQTGDKATYHKRQRMERQQQTLSLSQTDYKNQMIQKQLKVMEQTLEMMERNNRWAPYEKGVGLAGKGMGSLLGLNKFSKVGAAAKNTKRFTPNSYR